VLAAAVNRQPRRAEAPNLRTRFPRPTQA